jgi:hypothetical protein
MAQNPDVPEADNGVGQFDLGAVSKFGAASAALAYATGTLTINIYLHQLGITDFSLAKPKLIVTGVLVLLTFLLLVPLPVFVAWRIAGPRGLEERTQPASKGIVFWPLLPLFLLIAASADLCFKENPGLGQTAVWTLWKLIAPQNRVAKGLVSLGIAVEIYVPVCVAGASAFAASRFFSRASTSSKSEIHPERVVYFLFLTALAVGSIIGYIYIFSITFYPAIPTEFGGGKPYFESFVIAEEGRCQLQQFGMPFRQEQPNVTKFLPVIHESDVLVAVWLETKKQTDDPMNWHSVVVQLDKTQISAAVADPRERKPQQLVLPAVPCIPGSSSGEAHGHTR